MPQIIQGINTSAETWTGLMWAVLWQSTLLIGVVGSIGWLLRRASPGVRYWLWQIVVIKLLLMPFWTAAVPLPSWAGAVSLPDSPVAEPREFAGLLTKLRLDTAPSSGGTPREQAIENIFWVGAKLPPALSSELTQEHVS